MNKRELVRCINEKTNQVKSFERWITEQHGWQNSTGFVPQELPLMKQEFLSENNEPNVIVQFEGKEIPASIENGSVVLETAIETPLTSQATHPPRRSPGRPRINK